MLYMEIQDPFYRGGFHDIGDWVVFLVEAIRSCLSWVGWDEV